ncbi:MAG: transcriptional repressor [Propionibacteriaceae bacterium]|jgi:Fur family ferric uptake transcriptional regulator|nr:transcriptional repressor [Propionibacteriaceae bacterium]
MRNTDNSRITRQRIAIMAILEPDTGFLSAKRIHELLKASSQRVGLATVYRTLQALEDAGQLDSVRLPDGSLAYRSCTTTKQHHHLICRHCGRTVEVELRGLEKLLKQANEHYGYTDLSHQVNILGTCPECAKLQLN